MDHRDHVSLIRAGVEGAGSRWLELGAGEGAFSVALADLLRPGAEIVAVDRDAAALRRLGEELPRRFPGRSMRAVVGDFRETLPAGPFDGVLAANSLHFVADPVAVLRKVAAVMRPGGHLVVVEYDADEGNRWVPHPFSSRRFATLANEAGLRDAHEIGRVPSRFLGAIYSALGEWPGQDPVLHSRLHGGDREK